MGKASSLLLASFVESPLQVWAVVNLWQTFLLLHATFEERETNPTDVLGALCSFLFH